MSTYIIIKRAIAHPLDAIWSDAREALGDADAAMAALGNDHTDAELDAAGDARSRAILTIQALPARNIDDVLTKLDAARCGADDHVIRNDCSLTKISDELCDLLNNALAPAASRSAWAAALADVDAKRRAEDAETENQDEIDRLVDIRCTAQDRLEATPAPDHAALIAKMEIVRDRFDGFVLPEKTWDRLIADVCRLGGLAVRT